MAVKAVWQRMTWLDRLLVVLLLVTAGATQVWLGSRPVGARVVVEQDGKVVFQAPLDAPRQVSINGPLGATTLSIEQGAVCILDSPCPRKICMGMGAIQRTGQVIACVPNHLLVRIEGATDSKAPKHDYDLLSR